MVMPTKLVEVSFALQRVLSPMHSAPIFLESNRRPASQSLSWMSDVKQCFSRKKILLKGEVWSIILWLTLEVVCEVQSAA